MTHLGRGDQAQDAVHHAQTGAEDGHNGHLLAGNALAVGRADGSLHIDGLHGEVTGGLIAHQHGDFGHGGAEVAGAGVFVPQDGQLMLQQGMIQNMHAH